MSQKYISSAGFCSCGGSAALLWAHDPISESRQPSEEAHSHPSSHYTQLVVTDESGDANQQLGLHTQLSLQLNRSGYQTGRPPALGSASKFCPSKVINTGQLWQSPATTDDECGLLLTIQTWSPCSCTCTKQSLTADLISHPPKGASTKAICLSRQSGGEEQVPSLVPRLGLPVQTVLMVVN